jgi:hypothetical protein
MSWPLNPSRGATNLIMEANMSKVLSECIEWNISIHEYVHYELEFDLNNPHVLYEEEVWKLMVPNIFEDVEEETLVVR